MFNGITQSADEKKIVQFLTTKQEEENMSTYMALAKKCFGDCTSDFTTKKVTEKEEKCLGRCVKKFLLVSERITKRFQEHNALQDVFNQPMRKL
ncbi:protein transporter tim9 [Entomophthora muscae]|uniref:Protein transporter tim9 n=1 Tax=Entomophthora muscae TaxID=34485 RepID=A0ACC2RT21_9FUNG|nr:protein transporter tim9 [Entomophthora muscae]